VKSLTEHLWFEVPNRRGFVNITSQHELPLRHFFKTRCVVQVWEISSLPSAGAAFLAFRLRISKIKRATWPPGKGQRNENAIKHRTIGELADEIPIRKSSTVGEMSRTPKTLLALLFEAQRLARKLRGRSTELRSGPGGAALK
jgi:hypothetical protein